MVQALSSHISRIPMRRRENPMEKVLTDNRIDRKPTGARRGLHPVATTEKEKGKEDEENKLA